MSGKPILPRAAARSDVEAAIDDLLRETGAGTAAGFIDALEASYRFIAKRPAAGSPHYAHELNLPGLRSRGLRRYPYVVFYVERDDHIDVWRVLHTRRDIPARMLEQRGSDAEPG